MATTRKALFAVAASAALVATLGLAACGGGGAAQSSSSASEPASSAAQQSSASAQSTAQVSSVDAYDLTSAWIGMGDDSMTYYFESSDQQTGAVLIYYTGDSTYERWIGVLEVMDGDQRQITDVESGEMLAFSLTENAKDDILEFETADGFKADLSPSTIEEVGGVLDEVSSYATKVGEAASTPSAADLGGEFLVKVNTEGLGQIAYTQGGDGTDYADSAFTHANEGEKITLRAKAADDWKFVKWTQDGKDLSTEPEVEVTVGADVEYVAVFEMK